MVVNEKNEGNTNNSNNESRHEDDMDKIEYMDNPEEQSCAERDPRANRGAGQVAKDLFKVIFDTINFKYKSEESNNLPKSPGSSTRDADNKDEGFEEIHYKAAEDNLFEQKLNNMLGFFVNIMKSPKSDMMERVRRKSSCFWSEASPSDFSRAESASDVTPEEATKLISNSDEKMETFEEFLQQSERLFRLNAKESLKHSQNAINIRRKVFKKSSVSTETEIIPVEKPVPFPLKDVIDVKNDRRRKSSTAARILKRKQKSLDESMLRVERDKFIRPNVEKKTSLVEYKTIKEMSGNLAQLLRRCQEEHESEQDIDFIDQSPDMQKAKNSFLLKSQDSIDVDIEETIFSKRSSFKRADTGSKLNMLIESKIAIARPDDFDLSPEGEERKIFQQREKVRIFKDMATSCDLTDPNGKDEWSLTSGNSHEEDDQETYLIRPDQLAELRRCAEIIFKEVQGNSSDPKPSGISVDIQCDVPEMIVEDQVTIQDFYPGRSGLEMINESFELDEHDEDRL